MVVTGTNFGSVAGDLKAYLEKDGVRKYECAIVSATDTSLTVYLRGGMPGEYKFVVYRSTYGRSYS
jgi:sugar/nucleoside kinase (ribokinase family)